MTHPTHIIRLSQRVSKTLLVLTLSMWLSPAAFAAQHALLIGISDYAFERVPDLEGPINDVDALHSVLVQQWQFEPSNITTLVDKQATEQSILAALDALHANSNPGDDLIVYFSGHGTSASDPDFGSRLNLPDGTGVMVTNDFHPKKLHANSFKNPTDDGLLVGRHELKPRLRQLEQQRNVLVIFDACFSGNATRAVSSAYQPKHVRQLNITSYLRNIFSSNKNTGNKTLENKQADTKVSTEAADNNLFAYSNTVYFGASAEDEIAVDFAQSEIDSGKVSTIDGKAHGGFTDALLRALSVNQQASQTAVQSLSFIQLFNRVVNQFNIHCQVCGHTPVSLPALAGADHALLNKTILRSNGLLAGATPSTNDNGLSAQLVVNSSIPNTELAMASKLPARAIMLSDSANHSNAVPDIRFARQADGVQALSADGHVITHFADNEVDETLNAWLGSRQWLKQRMLTDLQNDNGLLRVEFRHPLYGNQVSEGDFVYFSISTERESQLLALVLDSRGALSVLYPVNLQDAELPLRANQVQRIPAIDQLQIQVTPPWGSDQVLFYALPAEHELTESMVSLAISLANEPSIELSDSRLEALETALDSGHIPYSSSSVRIVARATP